MIFRHLIATVFIVSSLWSVSYEDLGDGMVIFRNEPQSEDYKRIAIVTAIISGDDQEPNEKTRMTPYATTVAFGTRSKEVYAEKHGYDFIVATKKLHDCYGISSQRHLECAWTKLAAISRVLDQYDWVFWSDADSIILNFDRRLEEFIDENYDVIACVEYIAPKVPGPYLGGCYINTGEVFYKNGDFAKTLIRESWSDHLDWTPLSFEQARINSYIQKTETGDRVLVYNGKAFNTGAEYYEPGDFIVHMYSYHGNKLWREFKRFERDYGWIIEQEDKFLKESR